MKRPCALNSPNHKWQVYNFRTKENVGQPYKCFRRATNRGHKLDLIYGAISYAVVKVPA